jgi:myo-inositol-1(or 4)-monophosphatase
MRTPLLTVISGILSKVCKPLVRDFGEMANLQNTIDGAKNFVKTAHDRTRNMLHEALYKQYPDHSLWFPGQIIPYDPKHENVWFVDPLSGMNNFMRGLGHIAISMALQEKGMLTTAVIYDPVRNEMFWALRGGGTFLDQTRLRIGSRTDPLKALLGIGGQVKDIYNSPAFAQHVGGLRIWGCAALDLAYVAAGRMDAYAHTKLSYPEMAAGILMIKEAGGMLTRPGASTHNLQDSPILVGHERMLNFLKDLFPGHTPSFDHTSSSRYSR